MADPSGFEYWQAGELPLSGIGGADSGGFEFWQAGEQPSAFAALTTVEIAFAASGASSSIGSARPSVARRCKASGSSISSGTLNLVVIGAVFQGQSISAGTLRFLMGQCFITSGASTSAGVLRMSVLSAGILMTPQIGLQIDSNRKVPLEMAQMGLQVDRQRTTPIESPQIGLQIDFTRRPPLALGQVGLQIDTNNVIGLELGAIGLQVDWRKERPETDLNCVEIIVEDRYAHHLALLDNAFASSYMNTLNDVGGGTFIIPATDTKANAEVLAVGNVVKMRYRNRDVGAWVIENIDEGMIGAGEGADKIFTVSGRGLLSTLGYGIIFPTDVTDPETSERSFTAVTPASILLELYGEFVSRGGGWLDTDFYPTTDSAGQAWTDVVTLKFRAGQNLLDVARQLSAYGMELTVDPDKTLRAWKVAGTDRSAAVALRHGLNILSAGAATEGGGIANVVLGEGQGIYALSTDAASLSLRHRHEYYLQVGNTADETQLGTANALLLAGYKDPNTSIQVQVGAFPNFPFFDYHVGDIVHLSIPDEIDTDYRVLAITIAEGQDRCDLRVTLELNSLQAEYLARLQRSFASNLQNIPPSAGAASGLASSQTGTNVAADGSNLLPGAIKQRHISIGLGADQLDAGDIPITDVGGYFGGTVVEMALQETLLSSGAKAGATGQPQFFGMGVYAGGSTQYAGADSYGIYVGGSLFPRKSVFVPATSMLPNPDAPPTAKTYYANLTTWAFQQVDYYSPAYERLHFQVELPHDWKEGTRIYPYARWLGTTDGSDLNTVAWDIEYALTDAGGVFEWNDGMRIGGTVAAATAGTIRTYRPFGETPETRIHALENYASPAGTTGPWGTAGGIAATGRHIRANIAGAIARVEQAGDMQYPHDAFLLGIEIVYEVDYVAGSKGIEDKDTWAW